MNKKTLIALGLFLVLLVVVYMVQTRPKTGERVGERPRPLAKIEDKAIKKLTITSKGNTVEMARSKDKDWKVISPVKYPADTYALDTAIEKIAKLEFGDLITERKDKRAAYEVDDKGGIRVKVSDGKKTLADFYLGKVVNDYTMFRLAGKDRVYKAVGAMKYAFERDLKDWRNRDVTSFKQEEARKVRVAGNGQVIVLSRKDDKASWKVDESPVAIDQLDDTTVTNLISTLSTLSASEFADDKTDDKVGLDKPKTTITVTLKDKKEVSLLIGDKKGDDDIYVKAADSPQVFVLKKYTVETVDKRPIDFRDKTVLSFKPDDAVQFVVAKLDDKKTLTFAKSGDNWNIKGKKAAEQQKVKDALTALSNLTAEGFARAGAEQFGMDKPAWRLEITLKDRTKHTLSVGSKEHNELWGVSKNGQGDLFVLRKYSTDRFLLAPKDFE